jgi:hypothetical protein
MIIYDPPPVCSSCASPVRPGGTSALQRGNQPLWMEQQVEDIVDPAHCQVSRLQRLYGQPFLAQACDPQGSRREHLGGVGPVGDGYHLSRSQPLHQRLLLAGFEPST